MEIVVKNKKYEIIPYECSDKTKIPFYINVTNLCNAKCEFCSNNHSSYAKLDLKLLKEILDEIHNKISRFSISGGETLIDSKRLEELLKVLNPYNIKITLNTNGSFLCKNIAMLNRYENIKEVHLSRHHYIDKKNEEIFKLKTLSYATLKEIRCDKLYPGSVPSLEKTKYKLNAELKINCLLIKGYIDSMDEVVAFLEAISKTDITSVGFVSLMDVNKFTKEHFVDYRNLILKLDDRFYDVCKRTDRERCSCANYLYEAENKKLISVYFRYTEKYENCGGSLFFDGSGLTVGY